MTEQTNMQIVILNDAAAVAAYGANIFAAQLQKKTNISARFSNGLYAGCVISTINR